MPPLRMATGGSNGLSEGGRPPFAETISRETVFLLRTLRLILDCIDLRRDGILIS